MTHFEKRVCIQRSYAILPNRLCVPDLVSHYVEKAKTCWMDTTSLWEKAFGFSLVSLFCNFCMHFLYVSFCQWTAKIILRLEVFSLEVEFILKMSFILMQASCIAFEALISYIYVIRCS